MSKAVIISGEASETESEDETVPKLTAIQGAVIAGEDSESENENDGSIHSAVSALNQSNTLEDIAKIETIEKYDSLLHQKLRECNTKVCTDLEDYTQTLVNDAGKVLNNLDQQLIKSQVTLQSAVTSLKSLSSNSLALKNKLHSLLSSRFISNINTSKN